jgi:hypothetical protein
MFFLPPLFAQSETGRARIALYEPAGQKEDSTLAAVLATVTDSVELSLDVLQRYDVKRLPPADPAQDLARVRAYCEANKIDQAILGSGAARTAGGYDFRLVVYDRRKDSITVNTQGSSAGALDMFDTTDALVASLLDGLSGTHLLFGSLSVETDPVGTTVAVNGKDVGQSPVSLRGLPVGTVVVTAHGDGREDAAATVAIVDGQSTDQVLRLARSVGTLTVKEPADAVLAVKSAEIGEKDVTGSATLSLPTGSYDVVATDTGLATVSSRLTISRNQASPWMPWTKAYLAIQPAVAGTDVTVDGQDRGVGPQVVEVDPAALHRVTLKAAHYQPYVADLGAAAGDKITFAPELIANPGSIKIVTSVPGVDVDLDNGGQKGVTPAVFDNLAPGTHVIHLSSTRVLKTVYAGGDPFEVVVKPDEQSLVSRTMIAGLGHLAITDAPPGSSLQVNGESVDARALTTGVEVPAGELDVSVTSPDGQQWSQTVSLEMGDTVKESVYSMTWHLPRRTIQLDGNADDWKGLAPVWLPLRELAFKTQPGTVMARGFACRDDTYLYIRFEFSNGSPQTQLTREIPNELDYMPILFTVQGEIRAVTKFRRSQAGGSTSLSLYNPAAKSTQNLGDNASVRSRIGDSSLEISIPLRLVKPYLQGSFIEFGLNVVSVSPDGSWLTVTKSEARQVAFDF